MRMYDTVTELNEQLKTSKMQQTKDQQEIESLKQVIESFKAGNMIVCPVIDLSKDSVETRHELKRKNEGDGSVSEGSMLKRLATVMDNVIVKKEKETQAIAQKLGAANEDLEDERDERGTMTLFCNQLQTKIDELAKLALQAGADPRLIADIKNRH